MQEAPIALISDRVASKVGEESFVQVSRSKIAEKYLSYVLAMMYHFIFWLRMRAWGNDMRWQILCNSQPSSVVKVMMSEKRVSNMLLDCIL